MTAADCARCPACRAPAIAPLFAAYLAGVEPACPACAAPLAPADIEPVADGDVRAFLTAAAAVAREEEAAGEGAAIQ
jgi:hypothetical protein